MKIAVMLPALALLAGVGGVRAQGAPDREMAPLVRRPLASLAARKVIVLPTHYLRPADSLGWAAQIANRRDYLRDVDAEISFALGERGLDRRWVFPRALAAAARRNPTIAPDPYDLAAEWLRPPLRKAPDLLPEPFASELRTLIAIEDGTQYVLFPVEIRFEPAGAGKGRAVLTVAVLDPRRSRIVWMGDIGSDPAPAFTPALAASAAEHLADLIAAR